MSCIFVCDACGRAEVASPKHLQPQSSLRWARLRLNGGYRDACSAECAAKLVTEPERERVAIEIPPFLGWHVAEGLP